MMNPSNIVLVVLAVAMLALSISLVVQINEKTDDRFRAADFAREIALRDAQLQRLTELIGECKKRQEGLR